MSKKYIEDYHHGQYSAPKPGDRNYAMKKDLGRMIKQIQSLYHQKMSMHQSSGGFYVGKSREELNAAHKALRDRQTRTGEHIALKPWWEEE